MLRVVNVPKRGIGDSSIEKFVNACNAQKKTLVEGLADLQSLNLPKPVVSKFMSFAAIVNDLVAKRDVMDVDEFVDYVYETVDFPSMYDCDKEEDQDRLDNIGELLGVIHNFFKDNESMSLADFLQSVTLQTSEDDAEKLGKDVLTIATVHGVKGLEFRCVFIVGLEDGIFPIKRYDTTEKDLEEERRIMYVAVTRAKERLYLTHAKMRYRFGVKNAETPSMFLTEAGMYEKPTYTQTKPKSTFNFNDASSFAKKPTPSFAQPSTIQNDPNKDVSQFKVGSIVEHTRFGQGEIIAITGENADIKFEGLGVKKFNMRLAPIKLVK